MKQAVPEAAHATVTAAVVAACLCTAAGFFGRHFWAFDLASHFRVQYFVLLSVGAVLLVMLLWGEEAMEPAEVPAAGAGSGGTGSRSPS